MLSRILVTRGRPMTLTRRVIIITPPNWKAPYT